MRRQPYLVSFLVPSVLLAGIFLIALSYVLQFSFRTYIPGSLDVGGFTLENFDRIKKPFYSFVLLDTLVISLLTAISTLVLSYPVAYALVRTRSAAFRTTLLVIAISPLFTGEIVRTYAWILILGTNGFVNSTLLSLGLIAEPIQMMYTMFGVVLALVQYSMPVMIILLATSISHINVDYEKAATNLGATKLRTFWHITLPLSIPGIIAGTIVIFAWTMSAFSTPQLIGGGKVVMVSNLVFRQGLSTFNFPLGAVLSLVALMAAVASLALMRVLVRRLERVSLH